MRISLRRLGFALPAIITAALASACAHTDLTTPVGSVSEATDLKVAPCPATARVVINKAGLATLEVRSGLINFENNTGTPGGKIKRITYLIKTARGVKLVEKEEMVSPPKPDYSTPLVVAQATTKPSKHDDTNDVTPFDATNLVTVTVTMLSGANSNLNHHDDDDDGSASTCSSTVNAPVVSESLVNLIAQSVVLHRSSGTTLVLGATSDASVQTGTMTHYTVDVINDAPAPGVSPTVTATMQCVVKVDGVNVAADHLGFTSGPTLVIPPATAKTCEFDLAVDPLGSHTISVSAALSGAADSDPTNNTVSGVVNITADEPLDSQNATPGLLREDTWYDGTFAAGVLPSGPVWGVSRQDASVSRMSTFVVDAAPGASLGVFTLTGSLTSGGLLFNRAVFQVEVFADQCYQQVTRDPTFINNAIVRATICAEAATVNGVAVQAIKIDYSSATPNTIFSTTTSPHAVFGSTARFDFGLTRSVDGVIVKSFSAPVNILIGPPQLIPENTAWPIELGPKTGVTRVNSAA